MGEFLDRINVARVVTSHLKTLTGPLTRVEAVRWSQLRVYDLILFYAVPLVVGVASAWSGIRVLSLSATVVALALFATLLLTILFQTLSLAERARDELEDDSQGHSGWARERTRRRLVMVTVTYHNLAYLFLVSLLLLVVTVSLESVLAPTATDGLHPTWTGVLVSGGLHLVLTLLLVLNRLYAALHADVRDLGDAR